MLGHFSPPPNNNPGGFSTCKGAPWDVICMLEVQYSAEYCKIVDFLGTCKSGHFGPYFTGHIFRYALESLKLHINGPY